MFITTYGTMAGWQEAKNHNRFNIITWGFIKLAFKQNTISFNGYVLRFLAEDGPVICKEDHNTSSSGFISPFIWVIRRIIVLNNKYVKAKFFLHNERNLTLVDNKA